MKSGKLSFGVLHHKLRDRWAQGLCNKSYTTSQVPHAQQVCPSTLVEGSPLGQFVQLFQHFVYVFKTFTLVDQSPYGVPQDLNMGPCRKFNDTFYTKPETKVLKIGQFILKREVQH